MTRTLLERHTPALVALIESLGVPDRDEARQLYAHACQRLATAGDAMTGGTPDAVDIDARLAGAVRGAALAWARSRPGRRLLFAVVQELTPIQQQIFQAYYWSDRGPAAVAHELAATWGRPFTVAEVLADLDAIETSLADRHRLDFISRSALSRPAVSLDDLASVSRTAATAAGDPTFGRDPTAEDETTAIARLHYDQALSTTDASRALHIPVLRNDRRPAIAASYRDAPEHAGPHLVSRDLITWWNTPDSTIRAHVVAHLAGCGSCAACLAEVVRTYPRALYPSPLRFDPRDFVAPELASGASGDGAGLPDLAAPARRRRWWFLGRKP